MLIYVYPHNSVIGLPHFGHFNGRLFSAVSYPQLEQAMIIFLSFVMPAMTQTGCLCCTKSDIVHPLLSSVFADIYDPVELPVFDFAEIMDLRLDFFVRKQPQGSSAIHCREELRQMRNLSRPASFSSANTDNHPPSAAGCRKNALP